MYATVTYTAVEAENSTYAVTFGSLAPEHIKVAYTEGDAEYQLTYGVDYTVNSARTQVTVLIPLPEADTVKVYRETPKAYADFSVDFQNGTVLKAGDLNLATKHLLYLIQDFLDRIDENGLAAQPDLANLQAQITAIQGDFIGASASVQRQPVLWAPVRRSTIEGYKPKRLRSRRTAGAVGENSATGPDYYPIGLIGDGGSIQANHGATEHLYPYMVPTGVDWYGLPHNRHKRLNGTSLGNDSGEKGYEFGHDIAAGDMKAKSTLVWELTGAVENAGWTDSFLEFAVEVNPTVADYAGPNLLRMVSPDLNATWVGERPFTARITMEILSATSWIVRGEFTIYAASGAVLQEWTSVQKITGADHNWLTDPARVQLRWRADKDQVTRLDTFTGEYQGERQSTNTLRLHIDTYDFSVQGYTEAR